jgi:hypothetical protein
MQGSPPRPKNGIRRAATGTPVRFIRRKRRCIRDLAGSSRAHCDHPGRCLRCSHHDRRRSHGVETVESGSAPECIEPHSIDIETKETAMNRYQPATSRTIAGLAAAFMTVATLAVSVLAPASMDSTTRDVSVASTSNGSEQSTSTQSGALTTSIDVVASRTTKIVPVVSTRAQFRHNLAS